MLTQLIHFIKSVCNGPAQVDTRPIYATERPFTYQMFAVAEDEYDAFMQRYPDAVPVRDFLDCIKPFRPEEIVREITISALMLRAKDESCEIFFADFRPS